MDPVAMAKLTVIVAAVAVAMAVQPRGTSALECGEVDFALNFCAVYLSTGGEVPADCCNKLSVVVSGEAGKGKVCNCLKIDVTELPIEMQPNAAPLSKSCGLHLPDISPTMDCSNVN